MRYEVQKVYNNNVVLAKHLDNQVILVSKGVGFGKKQGDTIENPQNIEKVFYELNASQVKLQTMDDMSERIDYVVMTFLNLAKDKLGYSIQDKEETMREHMNFAISRLKMGLSIDNPFLDEIMTLYRAEYQAASIARQLIKDKMQIDIGEEEQGFIALHLYAARKQKSLQETMQMTRIYKTCITCIEQVYEMTISPKAVTTKQFFNNIKIMIGVYKHKAVLDMPLQAPIKSTLGQAYQAAMKLTMYLEEELDITFDEAVKAYLAIDIEKLVQLARLQKQYSPPKKVNTSLEPVEADQYIQYLGGHTNIVDVKACTTRLRIQVRDKEQVATDVFEQKGIRAITLSTHPHTIQIVLGAQAEQIAKQIQETLDI